MNAPPPAPELDLADIQGNILTAYGRLGFPKGRMLLFNVGHAACGRAFLRALLPRVTTALRWPSNRQGRPTGRAVVTRPAVALNIAFTFRGLHALGVPTRTLRGLPDDFMDGMAARAAILGDDVLDNTPDHWDPAWRPDAPPVHILVMLNAQADADGAPVPELDAMTDRVIAEAAAATTRDGGVALLPGHAGPDPRWQDMSALYEGGQPTPKEHFGFVDAIGDPVFAGQLPGHAEDAEAIGQGAVDGRGNWRPIATGEFILGWADEAQEVPGAAMPINFSRNGSFFAYRKLHQHLDRWDGWLGDAARRFAAAWGFAALDDARETLLAKMAGRWRDGVPLSIAPDVPAWRAFNDRLPDGPARLRALKEFRFVGDADGLRCPVTSHVRRMNTRDMLDPRATGPEADRMGSALNNRRRILRRGLPYGGRGDPRGEHGIVMLSLCASLSRQFEFVQQQWLNYGLDFNAGNDPCPLVGNHPPGTRFTVAADPATGTGPFIAGNLPHFVSTRGGDYFFAPSMTALRMVGMGVTDPT